MVFLTRPRHAADCADGNTLNHHAEDLGAGVAGKLVHTDDIVSFLPSCQA